MAILQNIEIYRGDNRTLKVTIKGADGVVVDITNATIKFTVKKNVADEENKIQKTTNSASQISITDAANGEYEIYLLPADTQDMDVDNYEYDSELITAAGKVYTVVRGEFSILAEVTRP